MRQVFPVLSVVAAIVVIWYGFTVYLNTAWVLDRANAAGETLSTSELVSRTLSQRKPVLPAPHQVATELWNTTIDKKITSKRSLIYHGWVTLQPTILGFLMGALLGTLLAVGIVYSKVMDKSVMFWVIVSQTIPLLATAPMVIIVCANLGIKGLIPKALISTYLSFFPIVVGMVKGLRSPERNQTDLMHTYNANSWQTLVKLRLPASLPYLFTSLKVAVAIALVGTIIGELPSGAVAGLGARLLTGSYYGQTVQIWSALFAASILAAGLVALVGLAHRAVLARMGQAA